MLYIEEIELINFIQLKGETYSAMYRPYHVYAFTGPNGSGKSAVLQEHDPRPCVHGVTTIIPQKEGMKKLIFRDTEDKSFGLKVVHYYTPKKIKESEEKNKFKRISRHNITSFLYELRYDEVSNTIVNGQTSQFKEVFEKYFGVTYDSINITTIGVEFGSSSFNILRCSNTERYDYLKMILKNIDEIKKKEEIITAELQVINRRIKELKNIMNDISSVDYEHEIDKLQLDIQQYGEQNVEHQNKKMKLSLDFEKVSSVSIADKEAHLIEFKELKQLHTILAGSGVDDYVSEYKLCKETYRNSMAKASSYKQILAGLNEELKKIDSLSSIDKTHQIENIKEDIRHIKTLIKEENPPKYDISVIDEALNTIQDIHSLIQKATMYPDITFDELLLVKNVNELHMLEDDLDFKIRKLYTERSDLNNETISDHEKEIFSKSRMVVKENCKSCTLYAQKVDIENKLNIIMKNNERLLEISNSLENLNMELDKTKRMKSLYSYVSQARHLCDTCKNEILGELSLSKLFRKIDSVDDEIKDMRYDALNHYKLNDLKSKLQILTNDDTSKKIHQLETSINEYTVMMNSELIEAENMINKYAFNSLDESIIYRFQGVDRIKRLRELSEIIDTMNEVSEKASHITAELNDLDKAMITINNLINRKREELVRITVESERFKENSENYRKELVKAEQAQILKNVLSKKIPTVYLKLYMIHVKDESNEFLQKIGRYKVGLPEITYDESSNRNLFVIPVIDNGEEKSCSVLSKGEDKLISIAITLPLIYIASNKYRILRLDEMDSTLDKNMKSVFIDMVTRISWKKIPQIFIVSHAPHELLEKCIVIDLTKRRD